MKSHESLERETDSLLPRFYLPLLLALCFGISWRTLGGGSDFWAHAAIGRWIMDHGVPHQTLFLWSAKQDWIAHSWLSQLWFYLILRWGGPVAGPIAALLFAALMTALTIGVLWRVWTVHSRVTVLTPLFFALAIWCGSGRSRPRPELWSGLFFAVLLAFLVQYQSERKVTLRSLVGLVVMFALWANFHGGVAAGLLLIAVTAFADILQERRDAGRWQCSPLIALAACCMLAVCVTPFGLHYYVALLPVQGVMFQNIDEWKPVWKAPLMDPVFTIAGAMLALFSLLAWLGNEKRRWAFGVWSLMWALLFLSARRHMWMWALVSLAVLAANAEGVDSKIFWAALRGTPVTDTERYRSPPARVIFLARLGMLIFLIVGIAKQTPKSLLQEWPPSATSKYLPEPAARRLMQVAKGRRVFNDYEYSSYLQWRCAGHPPLYIDLLNAYPDHILYPDYFDMVKANPSGLRLFRDLKIDCVFLRRRQKKETMEKLASYLNRQPQWRCVYKGQDATIWLKKSKNR